MATAINEATGRWEEVETDGRGRVPAGYRTPTRRDRYVSRLEGLRQEAARLDRQGRVELAEQCRRTARELAL